MQKTIQYDKNFEDDSLFTFAIHPQNDPARGQVQFSHNLITNLFEKVNNLCTQEFPEIRIRRQILDHYTKQTC